MNINNYNINFNLNNDILIIDFSSNQNIIISLRELFFYTIIQYYQNYSNIKKIKLNIENYKLKKIIFLYLKEYLPDGFIINENLLIIKHHKTNFEKNKINVDYFIRFTFYKKTGIIPIVGKRFNLKRYSNQYLIWLKENIYNIEYISNYKIYDKDYINYTYDEIEYKELLNNDYN
jgi:hypothetical protein